MSAWKDKASTANIALVYPKAIGDLVFLLPALHSLRKALPEAHLTLVIKDKQEPLARGLKGAVCDEVLSMGSGVGTGDIRKRLAAAGIDLYFDLAGNDKSGLILAFQAGGRLRPHRSDCKGICAIYSVFADSMRPSKKDAHRVDQLLGWIGEICEGEPLYSFQMHLSSEAVDRAEKMIARHSLRDGKVVVLNIGASRDNKRWPLYHFQTLAGELKRAGCRVVITGAREFGSDGHYDGHAAKELHDKGFFDGETCVDLITDESIPPDLQLRRDAHFLRYSGVPAVVVGNDTGPMQIAGSVGTDARRKTISLFGPTNWQRYAPYDPSRVYPDKPRGDHNWVITAADVHCRPKGTAESCGKYRRGHCGKECMREIAPETVLRAVLDAISERGRV